MSDDNPCGEIHPLPCGVDKDCGFIENYISKSELRELVEEWRDKIEPVGGLEQRHQTLSDCADELEQVLEDGE